MAERRLAALEAGQQIIELKHRYWRACDGKDPDGIRACFVPDATIDLGPLGTIDGVEGLITIYSAIALRRGDDGSYRVLDMHHGMHPEIELTSDVEARGRWSLRFRQLDLDARTERVGAIEYDDRYRWVDGAWRIAASRAHELWALVRPLPEDATITETIDE